MNADDSGTRDLRSQLVEEIPNRLERARKTAGYESLRELHRALTEQGSGYSVSYPSVLNYHGKSEEREPPISYVMRVAEITGARLEWLATGEGDMSPEHETEAEGTSSVPLSGFAAKVAEGLERSRQQDPEKFDQAAYRVLLLPGRFVERLPFKSELSPAARASLKELATQLIGALSSEADVGFWADDMDRFADDVAELMQFPYERLGLREAASSFRYNQYVMSLVQALMVAVPKREEQLEVTGYPIRSGVSS